MLVSPQNGTSLQVGGIYRLPCTQMGSQSFRSGPCSTFLTIYFPLIPLFLTSNTQRVPRRAVDHYEGGWVALWGGIVVPDVHFLCQPWSLGKDVVLPLDC